MMPEKQDDMTIKLRSPEGVDQCISIKTIPEYVSPYDLDINDTELFLNRFWDHYATEETRILYEKAKQAWKDGDGYRADDLFCQLIEREPENPRAYFYLSQIAQTTYFSRRSDRDARASTYGQKYGEFFDKYVKRKNAKG